MYDYSMSPSNFICFCGTPIKGRSRQYCSEPCCRRAQRALLYGMQPGGIESMWERQGGRCAICGIGFDIESWKSVVVDHDHMTGEARGLLCRSCNSTVRYFDSALRRGSRPPTVGRSLLLGKRILDYLGGPPRLDDRDVREDAAGWIIFAAT